ncbi:hypothetical protein J9303_01840 [Bacillaceae bacterium Marseille-Q3522]|nr:hypothetical protein [Bacillaceae bacterium Marseille-Q3522]
MRRRYNRYALPPWLRNFRNVCAQFIIPIGVFQAIRTILLPSIIDIILLTLIILLAIALRYEMI